MDIHGERMTPKLAVFACNMLVSSQTTVAKIASLWLSTHISLFVRVRIKIVHHLDPFLLQCLLHLHLFSPSAPSRELILPGHWGPKKCERIYLWWWWLLSWRCPVCLAYLTALDNQWPAIETASLLPPANLRRPHWPLVVSHKCKGYARLWAEPNLQASSSPLEPRVYS